MGIFKVISANPQDIYLDSKFIRLSGYALMVCYYSVTHPVLHRTSGQISKSSREHVALPHVRFGGAWEERGLVVGSGGRVSFSFFYRDVWVGNKAVQF